MDDNVTISVIRLGFTSKGFVCRFLIPVKPIDGSLTQIYIAFEATLNAQMPRYPAPGK